MFQRLGEWIAARLAGIPARIDELEDEVERLRQEWNDFADIQARREERQRKRDLKRARDLASADSEGESAEESPATPRTIAAVPSAPESKDDLRRYARSRGYRV